MRYHILAMLLVLLVSCSREERERPSATSGDLVVFTTHGYADLIDTLAQEFARQYPKIRPAVTGMQTREAVVHLLNDSVSTVCIDREFNEEEKAVMAEAGQSFTATRIAWEALVVVVNSSNAVPRFTHEALTAIVTGTTTRWADVPGSRQNGPIEFVTTERNTGLYENTRTMLVPEGQDLAVFAIGASQEECVTYVRRSQNAITLVGLRAARDLPATARIVPLETLIDSAAGRRADIMPSQTTVYTGEYGLRYGLYLMTTERRSLTGSGFSTFLLTTQAQKLVQKTGLLPAVIPTRVIQLSSE